MLAVGQLQNKALQQTRRAIEDAIQWPHRHQCAPLAHTHISLQKGDTPGRLDHFCIGVENFDASRLVAALKNAGVEKGLQTAGNSVYVIDPDGIRVQMAPFDSEV